jgi:hypothetical protein
MVELRWVLTRKTFPALAKRTRYLLVAFDGETSVGRVYRIEAGQQHGKWKWSMTALRSNVYPDSPTTGEADSKEEAKRHVEEAYDSLVRRSCLN